MITQPNTTTFDDFNPRSYLSTYFASVMEDEAELLKWLDRYGRRTLESVGRRLRMCDLGSGPTVHRAFPIADLIDTLVVRDLLAANLEEIDRWKHRSAGAHDWRPFAEYVAATSDQRQRVDPDRALEQVRRTVHVGEVVDLYEASAPCNRFDAVTLYFVACSASAAPHDFERLVRGASRFVTPGGHLLAAFLGGCSAYRVGASWFPSPNVTMALITDTYRRAGLDTINVTRLDTPSMSADGFDHIFAVAARLIT